MMHYNLIVFRIDKTIETEKEIEKKIKYLNEERSKNIDFIRKQEKDRNDIATNLNAILKNQKVENF